MYPTAVNRSNGFTSPYFWLACKTTIFSSFRLARNKNSPHVQLFIDRVIIIGSN